MKPLSKAIEVRIQESECQMGGLVVNIGIGV